MDSGTYEVLYNDCYGGFDIPVSMIKQMFELHPPHTEAGSEIFDREYHIEFIEEGKSPDPSWKPYMFYVICNREFYTEGYSRLFLQSRDGKHTFRSGYIQSDTTKFVYLEGVDRHKVTIRNSPAVIKFLKDARWIDKEFDCSILRVKTIPTCCDFRIDEFDGKEVVIPEYPYKKTIAELLAYIDDHDESKLSVLTKKLVNKEITHKDIDYF